MKSKEGRKAFCCEFPFVNFVVCFVTVVAGSVVEMGGSPETELEELSATKSFDTCPVSFFVCLAVLATCAH